MAKSPPGTATSTEEPSKHQTLSQSVPFQSAQQGRHPGQTRSRHRFHHQAVVWLKNDAE